MDMCMNLLHLNNIRICFIIEHLLLSGWLYQEMSFKKWENSLGNIQQVAEINTCES